MPYIEIKVAGQLSHEQKSKIAAEVTQTMEKLAGKSPASTYIVFTEVNRENWSKSGKLLSDQP